MKKFLFWMTHTYIFTPMTMLILVLLVGISSCINSSTVIAFRSTTRSNAYEAQQGISDTSTQAEMTTNAEKTTDTDVAADIDASRDKNSEK